MVIQPSGNYKINGNPLLLANLLILVPVLPHCVPSTHTPYTLCGVFREYFY